MEPVKIFISYAHEDESYKDKLLTSLANLKRQGYVAAWDDRQIPVGGEWDQHIKSALNDADVILLLISMDFIASEYCFGVEVAKAIERHNDPEDNARVVPIILRHADWQDTAFAKLQALPKGASPIATWEDKDAAYLDIVNQLKKLIKEMRGIEDKPAAVIPDAIPTPQSAQNSPIPIEEFRTLIGDGKIGKAIQLMLDYVKDKDEDIYNQFIMLSSRNKSLDRQVNMGLLDSRSAQVQRSQITYALLEITGDL
jgi:Effector-associated domain 11/TIR domain